MSGMDCHTYIDLMTEYMEDDLSRDERALWEKHFADCEACKQFFQSFSSSVQLVDYLKTRPAPAPVRQRLQRVLEERFRPD